MQVDALALRLRPRAPLEAADLGVRLCQSAARSIYVCYAMVALPVIAVAFSTAAIASWLPTTIIWLAKPWFDRTILFVLSRAAFGQATYSRRSAARAKAGVVGSAVVHADGSPPVAVEVSHATGLSARGAVAIDGTDAGAADPAARRRFRAHDDLGVQPGRVCDLDQSAVARLLVCAVPVTSRISAAGCPANPHRSSRASLPSPTRLPCFFLEPFYVASGFAMYLNRRAELEAWDIEQEFRRAFAQ